MYKITNAVDGGHGGEIQSTVNRLKIWREIETKKKKATEILKCLYHSSQEDNKREEEYLKIKMLEIFQTVGKTPELRSKC